MKEFREASCNAWTIISLAFTAFGIVGCLVGYLKEDNARVELREKHLNRPPMGVKPDTFNRSRPTDRPLEKSEPKPSATTDFLGPMGSEPTAPESRTKIPERIRTH